MVKKRRSDIVQLQIGKNGLTDAFIENLKRLFENELIVKVSILKSACRDKNQAKEISDTILQSLGKNYTSRLVGYTMNVKKFRKNIRD
jgi:RNA-binding protein YhbY